MKIDLDTIRKSMQDYFGNDLKRINHALSVADYSKQLLEKENADKDIVLASAYLHDIGIHEAEKKHKTTAGKYQEIEGPSVAKEIMKGLQADDKFIDKVCSIISKHHTLNGLDTNEFQVLYEADWIVNLGDDFKDLNRDKKRELIEKNFKTETGKQIAYRLYLKS